MFAFSKASTKIAVKSVSIRYRPIRMMTTKKRPVHMHTPNHPFRLSLHSSFFLSFLLNHTPSDGHVLRMGPAPISEASIDENMILFHPAPVETVYTVATARPIQSKLLYVFNHARCCPVVASGPCTHTGVDRQHICTCDTHQCCKGIAHCPGTFVLVIRSDP